MAELQKTVEILCNSNGEPGALLDAGEVVHVPFKGISHHGSALHIKVDAKKVWADV